MKNMIIGIDLGTTNSCVYAKDDAKQKFLETPEGKRTITSVEVVAFKDVEAIIGKLAKNNKLLIKVQFLPLKEKWKQKNWQKLMINNTFSKKYLLKFYVALKHELKKNY